MEASLVIDYSEALPVENSSTLSMVNNFILTTTTFLNRFSYLCEQKLMTVSANIQQLEITLSLLESKLQSIESTGSTTTTTAAPTAAGDGSQPVTATGGPPPPGGGPPPPGGGPPPPPGGAPPPPGGAPAAPAPPPEPEVPSLTWRRDPRYSKFFSLLEMGVPLGQIQRDMMLKGFDPSVLENPTGASDYVEVPAVKNSFDTESEEDDWD
eukprot:TRINITY_DN1088_c0_g1_i1.p1 TRINITY_DN1088_c0_g1~~TRINITY_DN1088_c0_g1_i1.p1  ORF type:complete len:210 (+),score=66.53 TRINITY_DN1088_c0_g1_i1:40-669(+)